MINPPVSRESIFFCKKARPVFSAGRAYQGKSLFPFHRKLKFGDKLGRVLGKAEGHQSKLHAVSGGSQPLPGQVGQQGLIWSWEPRNRQKAHSPRAASPPARQGPPPVPADRTDCGSGQTDLAANPPWPGSAPPFPGNSWGPYRCFTPDCAGAFPGSPPPAGAGSARPPAGGQAGHNNAGYRC